MAWTVGNVERDRETIDAIEGHDDRAAAIVAAAYLEDRLASVLKGHDIRPPRSFREKIDTACRHALFAENSAQRLHTIREIRNNFAHSLSALNFNSPAISELCKKLFSIEQFRTLQASVAETFHDRRQIVNATAVLVAPMVELPDTPRNTYMNAIKFLLFYLELFKASALMGDNESLAIVIENTLPT